jgi:hypothetical protein
LRHHHGKIAAKGISAWALRSEPRKGVKTKR